MGHVSQGGGEQMCDDGQWSGLSVSERYQSSVGNVDSGATTTVLPSILSPFRTRLLISDALVLLFVMLLGLLISSRASTWAIDPLLAIYGVPLAITAVWLALLALRGAYDQRVIGLGTEEIRRVVSATLYTFAAVAGISFLVRADISRAYAFVSLPLGLFLMIALRFIWRGWLYRRRRRGHFQHRTVVVGGLAASAEIDDRLTKDSYAGYAVVARCPAPEAPDIRITQWLDDIDRALDSARADAVAVAPSETLTGEAIRQLAWRLEGRNIDLLIAPAMIDIGGPRLSVRPAAGLPLLHLDEVALSRPQRFIKRSLDLIGALTMLIVLSPALIVAAIAVKASSRGPVIFRQLRIGREGEPFIMLKLRTMVRGAEALQENLRQEHDLDEPMFKLDQDPRITRVGVFLRRWSLDELPQLFNVLGGSMSLVGPRPHPLDDVDRYELQAFRRLALKPGLTGLWQVEGRSSLGWSEALQLDLYYVESWSLSGDVVLLARTVRAVIQGRGAM